MATVAIAIVLLAVGAGFASSVVLATEDTCASMGAVADPANNPGLVSDCAALLAARDTLVGTATLNWAAETPIADWDGVTVSGTPLRVTRLTLLGRQLTGEIPTELGDLSNLQRLYLNDNSGLSGPLPGPFTGLTSLTYLDLSGTGVCAPTDASFQAWLENIATRLGVVNCREQTTGDPLIDRYDTNSNATIEKSEVLAAITDYLFGGAGETISKAEVLRLITLYLFGPATPHNPPGTPKGLTAAGNGQTRIDLSWSAPPSDGGAAITGYRIEVSEDRSTWTDLVANTGNAATSYSHTGLTAGTTRHYQVSAINSAGTGPASNIITGTTDTSSAAPDLVVGTPSVDDSSPTTGESFTLSATVRNQGSGSSAATTLRYYRSTDATISSSDTSAGTDVVGGLSASGTSPESISVTAPSTAGTYYYGACVDSVSGESNTGNNCSSGVTVTVAVATAPDLVVGTPSASPSSPTAGESFTLSATVRNQGDGPSAATTLRYYRSTDATISSSDTSAGTDVVGGLSASGTSAESTSVTAPSSAGTYYYGACVDSVSGESNTGNNCSVAVAVAVGTPPAPDLVVGAPTVDDSSPTTGESFTLSATVSNQGSASSISTTLRYYRSTDSSISSSDTAVGTDSVSGLSASGTSDESIDQTAPSTAGTYYYGACVEAVSGASGTSAESTSVTAPSTAGTYYYGACVDSVSGESNTGNNCSSGVTVTVAVATAPDLVVGTPSASRQQPDGRGSRSR